MHVTISVAPVSMDTFPKNSFIIVLQFDEPLPFNLNVLGYLYVHACSTSRFCQGGDNQDYVRFGTAQHLSNKYSREVLFTLSTLTCRGTISSGDFSEFQLATFKLVECFKAICKIAIVRGMLHNQIVKRKGRQQQAIRLRSLVQVAPNSSYSSSIPRLQWTKPKDALETGWCLLTSPHRLIESFSHRPDCTIFSRFPTDSLGSRLMFFKSKPFSFMGTMEHKSVQAFGLHVNVVYIILRTVTRYLQLVEPQLFKMASGLIQVGEKDFVKCTFDLSPSLDHVEKVVRSNLEQQTYLSRWVAMGKYVLGNPAAGCTFVYQYADIQGNLSQLCSGSTVAYRTFEQPTLSVTLICLNDSLSFGFHGRMNIQFVQLFEREWKLHLGT